MDRLKNEDGRHPFVLATNQIAKINRRAALCDHRTDIVPDFGRSGTRGWKEPRLGVEDPSYKTEGFVFEECVRLAVQLKAIDDGRDPAEADPGADVGRSFGEEARTMMARRMDCELPWGNWLRMEMNQDAKPVFIDDETGERWPSLRSALWSGQLRMNLYNREPSSELLETMHAVLAATVRRSPTVREHATDLFQRSKMYMRMFHLWLESNDLVGLGTDGPGANGLTSEGWSVLHMLMATRPYDVRENVPRAQPSAC